MELVLTANQVGIELGRNILKSVKKANRVHSTLAICTLPIGLCALIDSATLSAR
jgi:hypothetical protein